MNKISVKQLADFMLASSSRQRSIVRDAKYPKLRDGKPKPQIVRYSEARSAIREYHESGRDISVLLTAVEKLIKKKAEHPEKDGARIDDNIRAIKAYISHFQNNNFTILNTPRPVYIFDQMLVSATPDLYVEESGIRKLIKLDFSERKPNGDAIAILLKVMFEAASREELAVKPKDVVYLDVSRREQHIGAKLNKKLKKDIDAALATIQDMWANIRQD